MRTLTNFNWLNIRSFHVRSSLAHNLSRDDVKAFKVCPAVRRPTMTTTIVIKRRFIQRNLFRTTDYENLWWNVNVWCNDRYSYAITNLLLLLLFSTNFALATQLTSIYFSDLSTLIYWAFTLGFEIHSCKKIFERSDGTST